ncbi:MG2 domain-containing protein [Undibacterium sp. TS12]|uniref:MG2 domain-containing protein n=1 Tax=Undibacterium sp. TS12 TaxID=2908202 RepID=UPI001F4CC41D|nr:MG2 domain-containing protein [Undibacterium sp. TS12]MCH8618207.1 MG2 domain-containing protein [Undibacterium sp. TS12]
MKKYTRLPSSLALPPLLTMMLSACQLSSVADLQADDSAGQHAQASDISMKTHSGSSGGGGIDDGAKKAVAAVMAEAAPPASARENTVNNKDLPGLLASYFDGNVGHNQYIQVDKPLYKPGETIWFKTWDLRSRTMTGVDDYETTVELISPKGASVIKKRLRVKAGSAENDFEIPAEAQGGEYKLRTSAAYGQPVERSIIVSAYEAPRLKKTLEFVKKSYGAGELVSATIAVKRPTGEVLGNKRLSAVITIDGRELPRVSVTTNAEGEALVKFDLPKQIETGEGLLSILVEDGGITESISKSIPILQNRMALSFFPEGGKMVAGLPTRLYFEAKTRLGKPADVEGRLVDDLGHAVATFSTYKNGLGRIAFTPATGRSYHAEISKPSAVTEQYALPLAEEKGCVMRSYDDLDGQEKALRIAVQCTEKQKVVVAATVRENVFDTGTIEAGPGKPSVIYLSAKDAAVQNAAGIARVTVLDQSLNPLAERLVFRNRRNRLDIKVETDKKNYTPRGQVALAITTRDASGKPVPADIALAVVDDTVLSFADDKTATMLSRLLLESELPGKIEEPNFYTDLSEDKSALALDMLMGTRGYRRFDWVQIRQETYQAGVKGLVHPMPVMAAAAMPAPAPVPVRALAAPVAPAAPMAPPMPAADLKKKEMAVADAAPLPPMPVAKPMADRRRIDKNEQPVMAGMEARPAAIAAIPPVAQDVAVMEKVVADKDFEYAMSKTQIARKDASLQQLAPVRVFPVPAYTPDYAGPRDDYRETVLWVPSVKTDRQGKATVKFVLSDAVTSFRVTAEGAGNGQLGHHERVIKSSLPFSLSAKLPLEISAGDKPLIPVTLTNESEQALQVRLNSNFGSLLKVTGNQDQQENGGQLPAGQRKSLFIPVEVNGTRGLSQVQLSASASGLKDEVLRSIPVVAPGFPQLFEKSGQIKGQASHDIDLGKASKGSVQASIKVYTSPLSTMVSGLEGMLREPSGCFEQTSSTNYPNVMIMQYMKQHDVADSALLERTNKLLDNGYKKLAGFESPKKGYEWFGGDPGHEALTAYGLLEFADMKGIYGAVDKAMLARTAAWLKARRDGSGGYQRDGKALDTFGRATPEVTDAYITWALVMAGETGLDKEVAKSVKLAETTQDAYQLALATASMLEPSSKAIVSEKSRRAAVEKLAAMQTASGAWTNADHSITRSGGSNLHIETTALAIMAMLKADGHLEQARKGINWLQANRSGFGQWGATQATVLALKAMIAFDEATKVAPAAGTVSLLVDGVVVRELSYEAGRREPLQFQDFDDLLKPGKHNITLKSKNGSALPYSIAIEYRSSEPASSGAAVVDLQTRLAKSELKMGETVRLDATISNKTQTGQPMSLVRLGLPGGLTFQNWQLKEMREKGQIAFFETRAREVILYFRDMKPGEVKKLAIDLVASVPGTYTGPASSAYLYYNDTDKTWTSPLAIRITP